LNKLFFEPFKKILMRPFIICLLLAVPIGLLAQNDTPVWKTLAKISYKKDYDELLGFKVDKPVFSEDVKALAGQEIVLKGYIIPVQGYESQTEFIFSAFPYNMCFFCGGAGPETVVEVVANEGIKYTADPIVIKGKLNLNDKDVNRLMYQLTDVTLQKD